MTGTTNGNGNRRSFWRRHRWIWWVAGGFFCFLAAVAIILSIAASRFEPFIRAQIVNELERRFQTRVELAGFHIAVRHGQQAEWGLWATGRGLRIWPPHQKAASRTGEPEESPPLIDLAEFSFHVPLRYQMTQHLHIAEVRLKQLVIAVPPPSQRSKNTGFESAVEPPGANGPGPSGTLANVTIGRVICEGGDVMLETSKPGRAPLEFPIAHLTLTDLAAGKPMGFEAELTNPRPRGVVNASGSFGPWVVDDPGESAVSGKYRLEHADLATFNGIAGILASTGTYDGTLRHLAVVGDANVTDFRLTSFGNSLPLNAKFHARVNATDGDTWLEPVDATLGHSHFTTQGKVVRVSPGVTTAESREPAGKPAAGRAVLEQQPAPAVLEAAPSRAGHLIDLKVDVDRGNLDDFLRLVSRSPTPGIIGTVTSKATLHIPPGDAPLHLRMKIDGYFKLDDARFTDPKVQDRVEELSLRGQGHPKEMKTADPNSIHSAMEGNFHVDHGVITLPDLKYDVPGADIAVNGTYAFDGHVKFEGTARMQATVSQMVGGWKGLLLKPVDRFFRKDGSGTLIPIHIRGTRDAPQIGIDFDRLKQTSPERPGDPRQSGDKDQTHPETPH